MLNYSKPKKKTVFTTTCSYFEKESWKECWNLNRFWKSKERPACSPPSSLDLITYSCVRHSLICFIYLNQWITIQILMRTRWMEIVLCCVWRFHPCFYCRSSMFYMYILLQIWCNINFIRYSCMYYKIMLTF